MHEQDPSLMAERREGERQPPPGPAEQATDSMPGSQELIKQLELQALEHHDAWLRAKAEADNIRKRAQADIASAHRYALEQFASELLPVRDSLEAALASDHPTGEALRQGVELTLKQLTAAFDKHGIQEINPLGAKFDPHRHQAITTVESEKPANTVVNVLQKGYLLHDRVLRPALVIVAKAKQEQA